eukprot:Pgem_evm1s7110
MRRTAQGRVYYVDHNRRQTTWTRPTASHLNNLNQWQNRDLNQAQAALHQRRAAFSPNTAAAHRPTPRTSGTPAGTGQSDPMPPGW